MKDKIQVVINPERQGKLVTGEVDVHPAVLGWPRLNVGNLSMNIPNGGFKRGEMMLVSSEPPKTNFLLHMFGELRDSGRVTQEQFDVVLEKYLNAQPQYDMEAPIDVEQWLKRIQALGLEPIDEDNQDV